MRKLKDLGYIFVFAGLALYCVCCMAYRVAIETLKGPPRAKAAAHRVPIL